jgi:hypothetical protein
MQPRKTAIVAAGGSRLAILARASGAADAGARSDHDALRLADRAVDAGEGNARTATAGSLATCTAAAPGATAAATDALRGDSAL